MTYDQSDPHHLYLLKFAQAFMWDPYLSDLQRAALSSFVNNASVSSSVFPAALEVVQQWTNEHPNASMFTSFISSAEFDDVPVRTDDVLIAAESFNNSVTVNGRPIVLGWTSRGFGVALIKWNLLRRYCGRQGILIEAYRTAFVLNAVDDMPDHFDHSRMSRGEKFNADGTVWSGNGSAHLPTIPPRQSDTETDEGDLPPEAE